MSNLPKFVVQRTFDAPRELVWQAWTDRDLLQRWYGPGVDTVIHRFDLHPGGEWLNEMKMAQGSNYQRIVFQTVDAPTLLTWLHHSNTDAGWQDEPNSRMPDWPRVLMTAVRFDEADGKTTVELTQVPHEATDAEIACFAEAMEGMKFGWGKGFDIIDEIVAELRG